MNSILSKAANAIDKKKEKLMINIFGGSGSSGSNGGKGSSPLSGKFDGSNIAMTFIEILQQEIEARAGMRPANGGLGETAIESLTQLSYGDCSIKMTGRKDQPVVIQIPVYFDDDLARESLAPERFSGVENIADLLNKGYSAKGRVKGVWAGHGDEPIKSLKHRDGALFIDSAIRTFMDQYATQYNVINIEVGSDYRQ